MAWRLSLFGPPRLLDDQGRMISVPAKTYALIAYLVLANRCEPATRASLRQFLWEDSESKAAATNMRKFLSRLLERQAQCGFELIRSRRDHVELITSSVEIDLSAFLQAVSARRSADLVTLCNLYRGDLLEGMGWEKAESSEWIAMQQIKLRDSFIGAMTSQLEPIEADTDRIPLRTAARRLVEVDPYNETGHRALMLLFAEDGEPARIRDTYLNLEKRLRTDLRVEPDPATTKLLHELLEARAAPREASREMRTEPAQPKTSTPLLGASVSSEGRSSASATSFASRSGSPRVTILPPAVKGSDSYKQLLAASLIEDVTIGLCRFKSLAVVAPQTAWELSHSAKKADLLRSFNIDYVVETKLQGQGDSTRLAVRLVNFVTRDILWIEQLEFEPTTMANQYGQLSTRIVLLLVDSIERNELAGYDAEQDSTAYHLYLAGQRCLHTLGLPSVRRARRLFKTAMGQCADFVPAISGLARTYQREWLLMARGDEELLGEAERLANLARDIDPEDARGHRELGVSKLYAGRFDESVEALSEGERRSPQFADLLNDFADAYSHTCDFPAALEKITKAIELNPLCPDHYWWTSAGANYHLQRYDAAIGAMRHMRDQSAAFRLMAASYAMLGDKEQARSFVKKAKDIHPDFKISGWLSIVPIQDPIYAKHYEQGLREAGFD
jgi:DNA-binding SARP family transcriptional activator/TolB-like protein